MPQAGGLAIAIPPSGFKGGSLTLIITGIMFAAIPCAMLLAIKNPQATGVDAWLYLFLGVFIVVGIALLLTGISSARQRFMLAVAEESLAVCCSGPFRTRERILTAKDIAAIRIGPSNTSANDVPVMELQIIPGGDAPTIGLMAGRSHDEINWIVGLLRGALHVGATARFDQNVAPEGAVSQPAGSKIAVQWQGDLCAYAVPPPGMFKGAALAALMCSVIWLSILSVILIYAVKSSESIGSLLFLGLFVAVGLALLALAIKTGRQRVLLAVTPDMIAYQRSSPFGTTKRNFQQSEIAAIRVGPSGTSVNNKPITELKIEIRRRGEIGLLQGCSVDELVWLAVSLRSILKVGRLPDA